MPVSLQQFFNSANAVGDSASLFLQNGGESVGDTSSLHGIHKLSRSAKAGRKPCHGHGILERP